MHASPWPVAKVLASAAFVTAFGAHAGFSWDNVLIQRTAVRQQVTKVASGLAQDPRPEASADDSSAYVQHNKLRVAYGKYVTKGGKVAVIGAGPSGIHMSRELQKRGFSVTILEATDRVGGKSFTRYMDGQDRPCTQRREENGRLVFDKNCIPLEYGTCFLHSGYDRVRELVHEYGVRREASFWSVVSEAEGFTFIRQMETEQDDVLQTIEANGGVLERSTIAGVEAHIKGVIELGIAKPGFFTAGVVEGFSNKFVQILKAAGNKPELAQLRKSLADLGVELYKGMNQSNYRTFTADQYTFEEADLFIKGEKIRGRKDYGLKDPLFKLPLAGVAEGVRHIANCIIRYNELREAIFGNPKFIMPARFNSSQLEELSMPFRQWMNANGLSALVPIFQPMHTAQGYGYLWEVPTYYGLSWMSPRYINGILATALHPLPNFLTRWLLNAIGLNGDQYEHIRYGTFMLPEGYHAIWREMHRAMVRDNGGQEMVHFNITNLSIERALDTPEAPVSVSWTDINGQGQHDTFDHLVYTAPHKFAEKYIKDMLPSEKEIFSTLEAYSFTVTAYRVDTDKYPSPSYSNWEPKKTPAPWTNPWRLKPRPAVLYNSDKMVDQSRTDNMWTYDRDDAAQYALDEEYAKNYAPRARRLVGQFTGHEVHLDAEGTPGERLAWWGDGSFGSGGMQGEAADRLRNMQVEKLRADFRARGINEIEVLESTPWPYFWHFPAKEIAAGRPWDLLEMQGKYKTWYLGASATFESVNDVVNYNLMMLDHSSFEGFNIRHDDEFAVHLLRQDMDGMYDPNSKCCCDPDTSASACALIPREWQQHFTHPGLYFCPVVKASQWPMDAAKESRLFEGDKFYDRQVNGEVVDAMKLEERSSGCANLAEVVILTVDAYVSRKPDCDDMSQRGCEWELAEWNSTAGCYKRVRCESGIDEDCGAEPPIIDQVCQMPRRSRRRRGS